MEKTAQRNIMVIYEDWRIFRKILKHDLALDRMSGGGVWRYLVGDAGSSLSGSLDGWNEVDLVLE